MKNSILKIAVLMASFSLFTACVNGDDYDTPSLECNETSLIKNMEVANIPFGSNITQYTDEDVVEAYVTSSDRDGNFFKSISMQTLDGAHAFSVSVDVNATFVNFEPGRKVLINLKNLYLQDNTNGIKNGGKLIGSLYIDPSNGTVSIGRLPQEQYLSALNRSCTVVNEDVLVQEVSNISTILNDDYLNKLIEIEGVQFTDNSINTTYYDINNAPGGSTNRFLEDVYGNTIIFRTSGYSTFAHHNVQSGNGKVRGILTKYGNDYQFMVRYESDIMLTNNRLESIFNEDFQTAVNNTNVDIDGWVNYAEAGTYLWRERTFQGNGYAEFSAYNAQASNLAWLITPAIDLSSYTSKTLQFKVAQHHLDVDAPENSLEVLISTDFDGTNVLSATWTTLPTPNLPTMSTPWYEFLASSVDISTYTGTIYVAFKFRGSNNTLYDGAFQVDDVKVFAN